MREIKFRAWHNRVRLMSKVTGFTNMDYPIDHEFRYCLCPDVEVEGDGICWREEDIVLMQYTGLKDKNGKEIYEGDVVVVEAERGNWGCGEVRFKHCAFRVHAYVLFELSDDVEVIGNIYENPELLDK